MRKISPLPIINRYWHSYSTFLAQSGRAGLLFLPLLLLLLLLHFLKLLLLFFPQLHCFIMKNVNAVDTAGEREEWDGAGAFLSTNR